MALLIGGSIIQVDIIPDILTSSGYAQIKLLERIIIFVAVVEAGDRLTFT